MGSVSSRLRLRTCVSQSRRELGGSQDSAHATKVTGWGPSHGPPRGTGISLQNQSSALPCGMSLTPVPVRNHLKSNWYLILGTGARQTRGPADPGPPLRGACPRSMDGWGPESQPVV